MCVRRRAERRGIGSLWRVAAEAWHAGGEHEQREHGEASAAFIHGFHAANYLAAGGAAAGAVMALWLAARRPGRQQ